jgi:hypothetical protein
VAVLAIAAAGALPFVHFRETPPQQSNIRFKVPPPDKGEFGFPALSLDGKLVAFVSQDQLWIHSFDSLESHSLPGTEGAYSPFWSPDDYPSGKGPKDVKAVRPHVGRRLTKLKSHLIVYWCVLSDEAMSQWRNQKPVA